MTLHVISHALCPYAQRAAIALAEKGVPFRRTDIDLSKKPGWFLEISPLGKTPVLVVGDGRAIFESAVILEYIEETLPCPMHPADPFERAMHRGWMEYGSAILNDIAGLYSAKDVDAYDGKLSALRAKFERLETLIGEGPWFSGDAFSHVDTVFGPIFRYFDTFEKIGDIKTLKGLSKVQEWRSHLSERQSVRSAVSVDYPARLEEFIKKRGGVMARAIPAC
ncbi:glutathione S-transferase family protein [Roseovarius sp.]|uniref:glutathione S-transferase family protein n=1 Tax=Roseovarius sp. TaxID=1486281 RepID=UPI00262A0326|nr:glutathione S-transferase family protein [Roseovarius sp.]